MYQDYIENLDYDRSIKKAKLVKNILISILILISVIGYFELFYQSKTYFLKHIPSFMGSLLYTFIFIIVLYAMVSLQIQGDVSIKKIVKITPIMIIASIFFLGDLLVYINYKNSSLTLAFVIFFLAGVFYMIFLWDAAKRRKYLESKIFVKDLIDQYTSKAGIKKRNFMIVNRTKIYNASYVSFFGGNIFIINEPWLSEYYSNNNESLIALKRLVAHEVAHAKNCDRVKIVDFFRLLLYGSSEQFKNTLRCINIVKESRADIDAKNIANLTNEENSIAYIFTKNKTDNKTNKKEKTVYKCGYPTRDQRLEISNRNSSFDNEALKDIEDIVFERFAEVLKIKNINAVKSQVRKYFEKYK